MEDENNILDAPLKEEEDGDVKHPVENVTLFMVLNLMFMLVGLNIIAALGFAFSASAQNANNVRQYVKAKRYHRIGVILFYLSIPLGILMFVPFGQLWRALRGLV